MTGKNRHTHHFNIPGLESDGYTVEEIKAIIDDGLREAGVDVETTPQAEMIDFGERLRDARQSELEAA